jgi:hypothetical protein
MSSSNRNNDLVPANEKLEWVTPKISLMEAEATAGKITTPDEKGTSFSGAKFGAS